VTGDLAADRVPRLIPAMLFILLSFQSALCQTLPVSYTVNPENEAGALPQAALILSEYLQHPSITGNEAGAGRYLLNRCIDEGFHIKVFSDKVDEFNFAASLFPLEIGLPNVIFLNHIDVVPPGNLEDWNFDPFSGRIHQGMIYGRGAIDMKSMAIMQLMAMKKFSREHNGESIQFNVTLLCVSGEEDFGSRGAGWVIENFYDDLNPLAVYNEGGSGVYGIFSNEPEKPVMCVSIAEKKSALAGTDGQGTQLRTRIGSTPHLFQ
jgi:acetylornithine deacetylase/succinyl-diaminopimelate desuccinylase-like protein